MLGLTKSKDRHMDALPSRKLQPPTMGNYTDTYSLFFFVFSKDGETKLTEVL